jgi:predicted AlkP superfamily pyrophosphatase or phosphodiesterase
MPQGTPFMRTPERTGAILPAGRINGSVALIPLVLMFALAGGSCSNSQRGKNARSTFGTRNRHIFLISVDGLSSEFLAKELDRNRLPNLVRLKSQGSYAEGVTGTYPSLTDPAHATLVTGELPAEHGVWTSKAQEENKVDRDWTSKDIQGPVLWDRVHQARLTSAAISWPLAAGTSITWDLSGLLSSADGTVAMLRRLAKWSTPGMVGEVLYGLGQFALGGGSDAIRARMGVYLVKKYRPNLLLVHFDDLDHTGHHYGPASPEAAATLERIDAYIGELLAAAKESGMEDTTDVFIVSDHGMLSYNLLIQPNVLLAKAGLLTLNEHGKIIGGKVKTISNDGSFFLWWPESENLTGTVEAALRPLREQGLVQSVLERDDLAKLGVDSKVQMALEAPRGAIFGDRTRGALVHRLKATRGAHGYLPFRRGMQAVFIAAGPGIKAGVDLHQIQMTAICPTVLKALGIDDSNLGGHLAIFVPGCCTRNLPVWSGTRTSEIALQNTEAKD